MDVGEEWHRWSGEWWSPRDWKSMPDADQRVRRVLGDTPPADLSYLLPPLERTLEPAGYRLPATRSTNQLPRELILVSESSWDATLVWRTAYALGLRWGNLDLFHWHSPHDGKSQFCIHRLEEPAGFLPERALEGDRIRGLVFLHEPDGTVLAELVWNRILLAAAAWIGQLGGKPIDRNGQPIHPWSSPNH